MNAAARGYKSIIVMPDTMTEERINLLKAYGAKVVLTPGDEKMPGAIKKHGNLLMKFQTAICRCNLRTLQTQMPTVAVLP